jgi:hypothetical protein
MAAVNRATEAVRYIVLQKLSSGLRHKMLGGLQAVQFAAELCSRMLSTGRDAAAIGVEIDKVAAHAMAVTTTCRSLVEWLRPNESSACAFAEALDYCLKLTGDDWMLRGIVATVAVSPAAAAAIVSRQAVCELVSASLLALIDTHNTPLDFELDAQFVDSQVGLNVKARASMRQAVLPPIVVGDPLDWADVALLAEAHGVNCVCCPEHASITLRFAQHADAIATQPN